MRLSDRSSTIFRETNHLPTTRSVQYLQTNSAVLLNIIALISTAFFIRGRDGPFHWTSSKEFIIVHF
jgi:hypothetical protein